MSRIPDDGTLEVHAVESPARLYDLALTVSDRHHVAKLARVLAE